MNRYFYQFLDGGSAFEYIPVSSANADISDRCPDCFGGGLRSQDSCTEAQVAHFAAPGSDSARDAILHKLRERIVGFAASRVQMDIAEDLAQEVLLLLATKYRDKSAPADLVPLAFRIVRFKLAAHIRKVTRRHEHLAVPVDDVADYVEGDATADSPETLLNRRQLLERLIPAFGKLGGRCRQIIILKLQGHGFPEIQRSLNAKSINTVYTWDARCRRQLLDLMGGSWEPECPSL